MINPFEPGEIRAYTHHISEEDAATFESGIVHAVYSTFALGRDAEWACRLFVLEMKDFHEEGIGTFLHINHLSPARVGEIVIISATLESVEGNSIICSWIAEVGSRRIAEGRQGQKIISKERLSRIFDSLV